MRSESQPASEIAAEQMRLRTDPGESGCAEHSRRLPVARFHGVIAPHEEGEDHDGYRTGLVAGGADHRRNRGAAEVGGMTILDEIGSQQATPFMRMLIDAEINRHDPMTIPAFLDRRAISYENGMSE